MHEYSNLPEIMVYIMKQRTHKIEAETLALNDVICNRAQGAYNYCWTTQNMNIEILNSSFLSHIVEIKSNNLLSKMIPHNPKDNDN